MTRITSLIGNTCKFGTPLLLKQYNELAIYVGIKPSIENNITHYVMSFSTYMDIRIPTLHLVSNKGVIPISDTLSDETRSRITKLSDSIKIKSLNIGKLPTLSVILGCYSHVVYLGKGLFARFSVNAFDVSCFMANLRTLRNFTVNDGKLVFLTSKKEKEALFRIILEKTDSYKENDIHIEWQAKNARKRANNGNNPSLVSLARYMMKKRMGRIC